MEVDTGKETILLDERPGVIWTGPVIDPAGGRLAVTVRGRRRYTALVNLADGNVTQVGGDASCRLFRAGRGLFWWKAPATWALALRGCRSMAKPSRPSLIRPAIGATSISREFPTMAACWSMGPPAKATSMIAPITKSFCGGWMTRPKKPPACLSIPATTSGRTFGCFPASKKHPRQGNRYSAHGEMAVFIV